MTVVYSPSHLQELLGIDSSTLRKYAILLEGHGYHIHRNNRGHRSYVDKDVDTIRKLIEFSKQEDMTMEQSVKAVMTWINEEYETSTSMEAGPLQITTSRDMEQNGPDYNLLERIEHLENINLDLIKLLKEKAVREAQLEEKINQIVKYVERMEQAEQSRMIIEETKEQIAATNQKKWWRLWN
nr:helix-turn-helix domain-containing protein [Neobacillus sp. Marseille-Q6967]